MENKPKIKDLEALSARLEELKGQGKKIVHCHGVFDLLHVGHIRHFEEAKAFGDVLVVTLTPDSYVNKGPHRPAFPQNLRAEAVAALHAVDYVAINRWPTAVEAIRLLKPDIYAKGPDYKEAAKDITQNITLEAESVQSVGGEIKFTDGATYSASNLLNKYWPSMYPREVNGFLSEFRSRHSTREVFEYIESLKELKVVVVGEAILDEYIYCDALGKSAKEPILAMRYLSKEMHAGGSLAVANHLAGFCREVELVTYLGTSNPHEDFVRRNLKPNVRPTFIYKSNSPTLIKRRYVENYLVSKLFEIYEMNDELLNGEEEEIFCGELSQKLAACHAVIVADYGHGLITPRACELLTAQSPFLAVNAQINAANIGFHTVSKYNRADYVCIHEMELRLDHRSRRNDLKQLMENLADRMQCRGVMVTRGKHGTLFYKRGGGFFDAPSFAVKVMDRIGAGDAVLALTSLCLAKEMPPDVINFIGNLVGAQAVMIVGNSASIDRVQLLKSIESFLK